ncbi:MAG TPA: EF-P lysine aminoacylase EpmA [Steroidobacteraceae bacterium]|jgi:lysyl-tRNA synthetase class 2|nr:EF-P lysine aminoacylase EpmA [Steroidobacteraceae bacterium]
MSAGGEDWRPSATRERLLARAALLARAREFFAARGLLEVDTPLLVNAPVSDVHIHSASVTLAAAPGAPLYLHTSPEYAMKRLLAAGSGDIYQVCHVVRAYESGALHNPEFTLIEWYRLGADLEALMSELEGLVRALLGARAPARAERVSYTEAFHRETGLDPLSAPLSELARAAAQEGFHGGPQTSRDEWLDFLMGARVGPRLGRGALCFVHGYPASQAALARLDPADARVARRFELYCEGLELANGFHELGAADEQRERFLRDNEERRRRHLPLAPLDERLLAALASGLPDCAGVALGFDRTLMLATGATHIDQVLAFPTARA